MTSADDTAPAASPDLTRLRRAFACAAVEPGLGGVLLFDVPPEQTGAVTRLFAAVFGRPRPGVVLGSAAQEDDLWTRIRLEPGQDGLTVRTRRGALVEDAPDLPPATVVVPDLARLGLPALRAAVTLVGADVAGLQRHGVGVVWRPRARWLAFCREEDVGRVSPHLLDRFPLRLSLPHLALPPEPADRRALTAEAARAEPDGRVAGAGAGAAVPPGGALWRESPERAALERATLGGAGPVPAGEDVLGRLVELAADGGGGERRLIALGRIARALARLDGAAAVGPGHADAAARLIGLPAQAPPAAGPVDTGEPAPDGTPPPAGDPPPHPPSGAAGGPASTGLAHPGDPAEGLDPLPAPVQGQPAGTSPYPEDDAEPLRDHAPLRGAWRRSAGVGRGPVIGVRRATDLRDLALVPTVVAAATRRRAPGRLTLVPEDLRSHVRAAEPDRMLVLLLDHTCRRGWDWQPALAPYLHWAYTGRAAAAVVEVGAAGTPDELSAAGFLVRNVLEPRLTAALHRRAGRATPLAHGLLLAGQFARRAFQQRPTTLAEAWLVVVTDGRGNVPLRTSLGGRTGRLDGPVGPRGVLDVLEVAGQLRVALHRRRLHAVVVDAGAPPHADLPFLLADALGGIAVAGPAADGEPPEVTGAA